MYVVTRASFSQKNGGAMHLKRSSTANIEHSTFERNAASEGVSLLGRFLVVMKMMSSFLVPFVFCGGP